MMQHKSNEETKTSIILYPLAHTCVVTHTDEKDSTMCG